jgi:hypothetical protein
MLKKNSEVKWKTKSKASFTHINKFIDEAPVLASPDYLKEFLIFSFASEHTIVAVLLQKNEEGFEQSIAFFSKSLRDAELKYDIIEKKSVRHGKSIEGI